MNEHGGKREGAGRKPVIGDDTVQRKITLTKDAEAYLKKLGNGSLSVGIQKLIEQSKRQG